MQRLLVPFFLLLLAFPLLAQSRDNEVGLAIGYADMGDFGDAGTFGLSYNRYFGNLSVKFDVTGFGAELATVDIGPGGDPDAGGGDFQMSVSSASLQYHFLRGRRLSPYVGAGVGYVHTELVDTPFGDFEADNSVTGLVSGGVDLNLGSRWAIAADATYMPHTAEFDDIETIDTDPLTLSAGVKFRW